MKRTTAKVRLVVEISELGSFDPNASMSSIITAAKGAAIQQIKHALRENEAACPIRIVGEPVLIEVIATEEEKS